MKPNFDIILTDDTGGPTGSEKKKRTRSPWVYKSEFDRLERVQRITYWFGLVGWLAFLVALKFAL